MKKNMIALLTGAALLSAAGVACATDLNLYGSSAQYPYWSAQAKTWLTKSVANGGLGCTATANEQGATSPGTPAAGTSGVNCYAIQATGCTSTAVDSSKIVNFRYCSNNSVTGVQSIGGTGGNPDSCTDNFQRKMVNPDATGTTSCQTVKAGIADVSGEAFTQSSAGLKLGPMGGATVTPGYNGVSTTGLIAKNTVVVPFGFFVNKAVTATQCTAGLIGNVCSANAECNTGISGTSNDGVCNTTPTTITNISRLQAAMLFSGQVSDWSQFGAYYTANPVVLCLRHAGSGTHATLDYAVMSAGTTGWGAPLVTAEDPAGPPVIWFNNGSGDMSNCINGDTTLTTTGSLIGAIGYSDADMVVGKAASSQNIAQVKYNGFYPTRTHIRNGEYDFYAPSWLYYNNTHNSTDTNAILNMVTYAQNPANVPAAKANYWAALSEMQFVKSNDKAYPGFVGASVPMTP
jgi:hypothetical protein